RTQPVYDLLARINPRLPPQRIVDLGCGPGNSTAVLHARWPEAHILGTDNDTPMLEKAQHDFPDLAWECSDIATWQAASPVDLLFSNAALQWLPEHATLFPRLLTNVVPGGYVAVQMPRNYAAPSHQIMQRVAA